MDTSRLDMLLRQQAGVLSRAQVLEHGGSDNDIARMLRRREWAQVHPGVYVDHTGPLSRDQHEWAALLYCAPAALAGRSALRRFGIHLGREGDRPEGADIVHLAVAWNRRMVTRPGIRLARRVRFDDEILSHLSPPRVRLEHVVLDLAAASCSESGAVAVICAAAQSRRTTAGRMLSALEARPRLRHRAMLRRILADVAVGAYSVLEREYLNRVERPHGLPAGTRQRHVRLGRTNAYRDVEYVGLATIIELDGRLGHELTLDQWDDLERDIDSLAAGALTARLGWAQVLEACRAAAAVAEILIARGWDGSPRACSTTCPAGALRGVQHAPGAGQTPQIGRRPT